MAEIKENSSFAYLKFKKLCAERNMTPYQVSIKSEGKISTAVLSQWKNGEYDLKLEKLRMIADVFGVPVTDFIE
jgi:repressor LexA